MSIVLVMSIIISPCLGFISFLSDSFISGKRMEQSITACSTSQAEYCSIAQAITEIVWLRWLLLIWVFLLRLPGLTHLYYDNKTVI